MEAVVKFAYDKNEDDELNLHVGDVVTNVIEEDEGWCRGTLNGVTGLFPDNFVELRPSQPKAAKESAPLRELPAPKRSRRAKVAFSYTAENEDELTLEPGQIVEVIDEEEEGWWRGALNGKQGVFPSNFVEPILEDESTGQRPQEQQQQTETNAPVRNRPASMVAPFPGLGGVNPVELKMKLKPAGGSHGKLPAAEPSSKPVDKPPPIPEASTSSVGVVCKAKVMFAYDADQEDEISVNEGDVVDVLDRDSGQDGWWKIRFEGKVGLVPDNFVEAIPLHPGANVSRPPLPVAKGVPHVQRQLKPGTEAPSAPNLPPKQPDIPPMPPRHVSTPKLPPPSKPGLIGVGVLPPKKESVDAADGKGEEFSVPKTDLLDNRNMKDRPKRTARPPTRKTSSVDEPEEEEPPPPLPDATPPRTVSTGKAPWQEELQRKKKNPLPGTQPKPSAGVAPPPTVRPKPGKVPQKPPINKPMAPPTVPSSDKPPSGARPIVPAHGKKDEPPRVITPPIASVQPPVPTSVSPLSAGADEWKDPFEKLRQEFEKFKKEVMEEVEILAKDLDEERKKNATMLIDIDRLKKSREFREKL